MEIRVEGDGQYPDRFPLNVTVDRWNNLTIDIPCHGAVEVANLKLNDDDGALGWPEIDIELLSGCPAASVFRLRIQYSSRFKMGIPRICLLVRSIDAFAMGAP